MKTRYSLAILFSLLSMISGVSAQLKTPMSEKQDQGGTAMAVVNGTHKITMTDVDSLFPSDVRSVTERLESLRASGLEALIRRAALSDEAQRRGMSLDAFLESLVPEKVEIDRTDVEREYLESGRSLGIVDEAEARVLLRIQIEAQRKVAAFRSSIAEFRKRAEIRVIRSGGWQPGAVISQGGHSLGSSDAIAVLTVFTDLECPYCKRAHDVIQRLVKEFGGDLRVVYKHFPLSIHRNAFAAAAAAECAGRQNKFWPYLDLLFSTTELNESLLRNQAEILGLDLNTFDECRKSSEVTEVVLGDMKDARQAAVDSTPSMFLNGRMFRNPSYESLKGEIELETSGQRTGPRGTRTRNGEQIR